MCKLFFKCRGWFLNFSEAPLILSWNKTQNIQWLYRGCWYTARSLSKRSHKTVGINLFTKLFPLRGTYRTAYITWRNILSNSFPSVYLHDCFFVFYPHINISGTIYTKMNIFTFWINMKRRWSEVLSQQFQYLNYFKVGKHYIPRMCFSYRIWLPAAA
jgi:hypothetical protein